MPEIITSVQNSRVKAARSLSNKKFRKSTGLFIVEGANLLHDMPSSVKVKEVFCTLSRCDEAERLCERFCEAALTVVSDSVMQAIADTVTPYGIAAVCETPSLEFELPAGNALLLDAVSDPGNLGTILRTAAACGFEDVYLLECADVFSPKTVRATLGGLFKVRVHEICEDEALALVGATKSAALDMRGENILTARLTSPILFIAGNEAHGVRNSIRQAAKRTLSLPMKNAIESLNVAVATAVAMFKIMEEQI